MHLKKHKHSAPDRPVVNNTQIPNYSIAKYFNYRLNNSINLPHKYTSMHVK